VEGDELEKRVRRWKAEGRRRDTEGETTIKRNKVHTLSSCRSMAFFPSVSNN
jgi:hypothetical protein